MKYRPPLPRSTTETDRERLRRWRRLRGKPVTARTYRRESIEPAAGEERETH
jgi:hypothetical protein